MIDNFLPNHLKEALSTADNHMLYEYRDNLRMSAQMPPTLLFQTTLHR